MSSSPPARGPGWSGGRAPPGWPAFRTPLVEPVELGIGPVRRLRLKERFRWSGRQHREHDDATMPAPSIRWGRPGLRRVWTRSRPYAFTVLLGRRKNKESGAVSLREVVDRGPPALRSGLLDRTDGIVSDPEGATYHLAHKRVRLDQKDYTLSVGKDMTRDLRRQEVETWKKVIRVFKQSWATRWRPSRRWRSRRGRSRPRATCPRWTRSSASSASARATSPRSYSPTARSRACRAHGASLSRGRAFLSTSGTP